MTENRINYKKLCVRLYKNTYIYPKTIPKERGNLVTIITGVFCVILLIGNVTIDDNSIKTILMNYCSGIVFVILLEILYRVILMCEELNHVTSRYDDKIINLIQDTFNFKTPVWVTFVLCIIYSVYYLSTDGFSFGHIGAFNLSLLVMNIYFLLTILKLNVGPLNDSLWVAKNNGLDYGSGMAYSFFHGYLNLVLPKTGREDKNLSEIMQDYEDKHGVKFDVYKLFILIPKSMTCFVSLQNESSPSVEESSSLEEKRITVAGVQNRVYKNAVYKIVSEEFYKKKKKTYVSAEYATPLKTFKDVFDHTGEHSEYYNKHKKDIILQFYLTLEKILKKKGLNEFCELIYYEDSYQSNGATNYYDVGEIILERLRELKKKKD